jgi:hypothetical protein
MSDGRSVRQPSRFPEVVTERPAPGRYRGPRIGRERLSTAPAAKH